MKHITISGSLGSGKSAVSSILKEKLELEVESVGSILRKMAQNYGMSTNDFNKYIENHPEVDYELDEFVRKEGLKITPKIFDSRLAWHFIPQSFKVFLYVKDDIAAKRVFNDTKRVNEQYENESDTLFHIIERRKSEVFRYKKQYNLELENLYNYDLVIDTSYSLPEEIANKIISNFINNNKNQIWISPYTLLPTQSIREHSNNKIEQIGSLFSREEDYMKNLISILLYKNTFYIYDGHKRVLNAIKKNINLVPCFLINSNDDYIFRNNQNIENYIMDNFSNEFLLDWNNFVEFLMKKSHD